MTVPQAFNSVLLKKFSSLDPKSQPLGFRATMIASLGCSETLTGAGLGCCLLLMLGCFQAMPMGWALSTAPQRKGIFFTSLTQELQSTISGLLDNVNLASVG